MLRPAFLIVLLLPILRAQTQLAYSGFVTGNAYTSLPPTYVALGQITTFFVAGLPQSSTAAITASITAFPTALTVFSVKPVDASTLAVTVQIPFVAPGMARLTANPIDIPVGSIQFCEQSACTAPANVDLTPAIPHVISTCDIFYSDAAFGSCQLAIFHQNGQYVSNSAPAASGEILTLWALGLGEPSSGYSTTATTPLPMSDIVLQAEYPAQPNLQTELTSIPYQFAGLPNPALGLYQINFAVPPAPVGLVACDSNPLPSYLNDGTESGNLSISVGRGVAEFFNAATFYFQGICVATP